MYHVLVVDDEPRHRRGLANMIREFRPDDHVTEARNGEEALGIIKETPIHIVITDIKMPIMDGLQLIEKMGERVRKTKVILLSGYGYFEYAQKALSLGAFDYILKPADEHRVVDALSKAERSLAEDRNAELQKQNLEKRLSHILPVYKQHQLNRWVRGSPRQADLQDIHELSSQDRGGAVVLAYISRHSSLIRKYSCDDMDGIRQALMNEMEQALAGISLPAFFYLEGHDDIFVAIVKDFDALTAQIHRLEEVIHHFKERYDICLTIGVGDQCKSLLHDVQDSFKQAQTALDHRFYAGRCKVIYFSSIGCYGVRKSSGWDREGDLIEAVRLLDGERALRELDSIMDQVWSWHLPPGEFKESIVYELVKVTQAIEGLCPKGETVLSSSEIRAEFYECDDYIELGQRARAFIGGLILRSSAWKDRRKEVTIKQCLQYIEQNFSKDLSLIDLAGTFYFNPSYFSALFKEHAGCSFSQYLNEVRMQKAKELLQMDKEKVYEIAAKIGFRDVSYFNRVFKKETGMTPDEFRRRYMKRAAREGRV